MAAALETSRLATYEAARRFDAGAPHRKQAAIAKLAATEAAVSATREATQIFGGYGFIDETPVSRYYRDAKISGDRRGDQRDPAPGDQPGVRSAGMSPPARTETNRTETRHPSRGRPKYLQTRVTPARRGIVGYETRRLFEEAPWRYRFLAPTNWGPSPPASDSRRATKNWRPTGTSWPARWRPTTPSRTSTVSTPRRCRSETRGLPTLPATRSAPGTASARYGSGTTARWRASASPSRTTWTWRAWR